MPLILVQDLGYTSYYAVTITLRGLLKHAKKDLSVTKFATLNIP